MDSAGPPRPNLQPKPRPLPQAWHLTTLSGFSWARQNSWPTRGAGAIRRMVSGRGMPRFLVCVCSPAMETRSARRCAISNVPNQACSHVCASRRQRQEARVFPTSGAAQAELLMGDIRSHSDRGRPRLRDRSKSSAYSRSAGRREPALTRGLGEQLRRPALGDVRISALTAEAAFRRGQFPRGIAGGVRRGNPATRTCAGFAGITTSAHGASLAHR